MRNLIVFILSFLVFSTTANAQVSFSLLPQASTLQGPEIVPVVQSGVTKKTTVNDFVTRVVANTQTFTAAQNFKQTVTFICGSTGNIPCNGASSGDNIILYSGYGIKWKNPSGNALFNVSVAGSTTLSGNLILSDSGLIISNASTVNNHQFVFGSTTTNGLLFSGTTSGTSPNVTARGTDTNLDLELYGKGTGTPTVGTGLRLKATVYGSLPTCNAGKAGMIAYITDASSAITAWHQPVTAGGGTNKAFISCNGSGWYAFGY